MNPTSDILERITESSKQHPDGVFTRLYRYLLREDIYYRLIRICTPTQGLQQRVLMMTRQTGSVSNMFRALSNH